MALGILGGMIAVVGVAAIVVATGGIAGAFLPVAAAGVVSSVTTSAAIGALVMGTMAVGSRAVADFKSGNVSDGSEYVKAGEHGAIVGAVTGAIGGGFEALSATWGLAATMTAMGVDGMVETWVQNKMDGVDTHWWELVGAFGFSALSYGILDNLARSAKGPKPQNLDDLDDYAKRLEDINNRSYDDWLSDTVGQSGSKTNWEAHNVVNYAKLKEQYRVTELANDVVDSITQTGALPSNFITKSQAKALGWSEGKALNNYAPGKALGGDVFANTDGVLPSASGRIWYEADIGVDYTMSRSNPKNPAYRILYSNDGLIYGTYDHYDSVFQIFP